MITCGGMGTRLFAFTKEIPNEMAPVFYPNNGKIQTAPLIQLIYETLYNQGIREFCFVTGNTKRNEGKNHRGYMTDFESKKDRCRIHNNRHSKLMHLYLTIENS